MDAVAALTMLLDHLGVVFFPDLVWLRVVGRLALPAYCCLCGRAAVLSRSAWRYALRVCIVGAVSVLAWRLHGHWSVNVCFPLSLGIVAARAWLWRWWCGALIVVGGGGVLQLVGAEYGWLPVAAVVTFAVGGRAAWPAWCVLDCVWAWSVGQGFQVVGCVGALLCVVEGVRFVGRGWRWLWLGWYPGHVAALGLIAGKWAP